MGKNNNCSASGFSLVEISLALLIIGVGMLAILGLFPAGLDQNVRSIGDTHAALFAQEVFSSMRVQSETNWASLDSSATYAVSGSSNWFGPDALDVKLDNEIHVNIYSHVDSSNVFFVDHAFRYQITLTNDGFRIKSAALRFWAGEFGTASNPALFYSEFYRSSQ